MALTTCCEKNRRDSIYLSQLVTFALGMVIFLSCCGVIGKEAPPQRSFVLSPKPSPLVVSSPFPTNTLTPQSTLPAQPLATSTAEAAPKPLDPKHWELFTTPVEVLQSNVQHVGQAEDGTMWFAGIHIYRYDGNSWSTFDQDNISNFRGRVILSLAVEPGGTMWVGTEMNEIVSFDGMRWASQTVEEGGYRHNDIVSIIIRKNGELCAASIEGLSCKTGGKWKRHPFMIENEVNHPLYVREPVLTASDEIWVPLNKGLLYHYDGSKWEGGKVSRWINSIAASKDGSLWISSEDGFGKRGADGKIVYQKIPAIVNLYFPLVMKETNNGTLWMGTGVGYQLAQYVHGDFITVYGEVLSYSKQYDFDSNNFPFYHVNCIFQAKDGSIWFGTVNGIFRYW